MLFYLFTIFPQLFKIFSMLSNYLCFKNNFLLFFKIFPFFQNIFPLFFKIFPFFSKYFLHLVVIANKNILKENIIKKREILWEKRPKRDGRTGYFVGGWVSIINIYIALSPWTSNRDYEVTYGHNEDFRSWYCFIEFSGFYVNPGIDPRIWHIATIHKNKCFIPGCITFVYTPIRNVDGDQEIILFLRFLSSSLGLIPTRFREEMHKGQSWLDERSLLSPTGWQLRFGNITHIKWMVLIQR